MQLHLSKTLRRVSHDHHQLIKGTNMQNHSRQLMQAIAGIFAISAVGSTTLVSAAEHTGDEKCAGVIKAGRNDCSTSKNACHSHVTVDADPEAWIWVPRGTCDKIANAHVSTVITPEGE
jgi:uncharacterized membrane protein